MLYAQVLGAVVQSSIDHVCRIKIIGFMHDVPRTIFTDPPQPLASKTSVSRMSELEQRVQLVLTDRSKLRDGKAFGVYSPLTWRLADLGAKRAVLRAGFE
jgi:hypothetical protein